MRTSTPTRRYALVLALLLSIGAPTQLGCGDSASAGSQNFQTAVDLSSRDNAPTAVAPADSLDTTQPDAGDSGTISLTLVHYNDFHAAFAPVQADAGDPDGGGEGGHAATRERGGIARLVGGVRTLREQARAAGEPILVVDAGDFFTGSALHTRTAGAASIRLLNRVRPDVFALGVHEFDHGERRLLALLAGTPDDATTAEGEPLPEPMRSPGLDPQIRVVSANTLVPGQPWTGSTIIDLDGVRVAVIGLMTPRLTSTLVLADDAELEVHPIMPTLRRELERVEALEEDEAADFVIVVSHSGADTNASWIPAVKDRVHLVVSGHDHVLYPRGRLIAGVPNVEAGSHGRHLGRVRLTVDRTTGELLRWSAEVLPLLEGGPLDVVDQPTAEAYAAEYAQVVPPLPRTETAPALPDARPDTHAAADPEDDTGAAPPSAIPDAARLADDVVLTTAPRAIALDRGNPDPLGTWHAEALLAAVPTASVAILNHGALRADLDQGPVTLADLRAVNPFGNEIVRLDLPTAALSRAIRSHLAAGVPLHLAGPLRVEVLSLPTGVSTVLRTLNADAGAPLELTPTATTSVVTVGYVADRLVQMFGLSSADAEAVERQPTGITDLSAFVHHARSADTLAPSATPYRVATTQAELADVLEAPADAPLDLGWFVVEQVVDGDTVRLAGLSESVRLAGIDTEEAFRGRDTWADRWGQMDAGGFAVYARQQQGSNPRPAKYPTPMGMAASAALALLVARSADEHGRVLLRVSDPSRPVDSFGRWLGTLIIPVATEDPDPRGGASAGTDRDAPPLLHVDAAVRLVRDGLAPVYTKYALPASGDALLAAQAAAREDGVGIWSPNDGQTPYHYPDYDARVAWWSRHQAAISAFQAQQARAAAANTTAADPPTLDPDDPWALPELLAAAADNRAVRLFVYARSSRRTTVDGEQATALVCDLALTGQTLWVRLAPGHPDPTALIGERLMVTGHLHHRDGRRWQLTPSTPDAVRRAPPTTDDDEG